MTDEIDKPISVDFHGTAPQFLETLVKRFNDLNKGLADFDGRLQKMDKNFSTSLASASQRVKDLEKLARVMESASRVSPGALSLRQLQTQMNTTPEAMAATESRIRTAARKRQEQFITQQYEDRLTGLPAGKINLNTLAEADRNGYLKNAREAINRRIRSAIETNNRNLATYEKEMVAYNQFIEQRNRKLAEQRRKEQDALRLATPQGQFNLIRNQEMANFLGMPYSRKGLSLAYQEQYNRQITRGSRQDRVNNMLLSNDLFKTNTLASYSPNQSISSLRNRLDEASIQREALKTVSSHAQVSGNNADLERAQKALRMLDDETKLIKALISQWEKYRSGQNEALNNLKQMNREQEAANKFKNMGGVGSFRTNSTVDDIRKIRDLNQLETRRAEISKELGKAQEAQKLAEQAGNAAAVRELEKIITVYREERRAIMEVNRELFARQQAADRLASKNYSFRSTSNLGDIKQTQDLVSLEAKRAALQDEMKQAYKAQNLAEKAGNQQMIADTSKVLEMYREELRTINAIHKELTAKDAAAKKLASGSYNLRSTSTVDDIRQLKTLTELEAKRYSLQKDMERAKQAMRLAERSGNQQAISDISKIISTYESEKIALNETNRELEQHTRMLRRVQELTSGEGLGGLFLIQGLIAKNYSLLNFFQNSLSGTYQFMMDFEKALKQTQAISQATSTQLDGLKESIVDVSNTTKFGAIELAEATTVLAQAGFSLGQIKDSLQSVAMLATATGSQLSETVDIATSVLGAFQMSASTLPTVANEITQAMNLTKLDIQKFSLAVQYAGNAAADAGLNFEELLASVAAVSNTGVKSGSTLGTGFRQLLADLISPSEKMQAILTKLGLTMADIDVRTNGLVGAIQHLKDAGFSTADAYQSFEVRAVAFYTALSNNLDLYDDVTSAMKSNTAVMEANAIQMDTLSAQTDRFKNSAKLLGDTIGTYLGEVMTDVLSVTADLLISFRDLANNGVAKFIVQFTALTVVFRTGLFLITLTAKTLTGAVQVFYAAATGMTALAAATNTQTGAAAANTAAVRIQTAALASLRTMAFGLSAGLALLVTAWYAMKDSSKNAAESLEDAKTSMNGIKDAISNTSSSIDEVDRKIASITVRFKELSENPAEVSRELESLREKAYQLGIRLKDDLGSSVIDLLHGWQDLRAELGKGLQVDLGNLPDALQKIAAIRRVKYEEEVIRAGEKLPGRGQNIFSGTSLSLVDFNNPESLLNPKMTSFTGGSGITNAERSAVDTAALAKLIAQTSNGKHTQEQVARTLQNFQNMSVYPKTLDPENTDLRDRTIGMGEDLNSMIQQTMGELSRKLNTTGLSPTARKNISDTINTLNALVDEKVPTTIASRVNYLKGIEIAKLETRQATRKSMSNQAEMDINASLSNGTFTPYQSSTITQDFFNQPKADKTILPLRVDPKYKAQWDNEIKDKIVRAAKAYGIDPQFALSQILAESSGNPNALGPQTKYGQAQGLAQLLPDTARDYGVKDRTDVDQSIEGYMKYMKFLLGKYKGSYLLAAAGYNAGQGRVDKYNGMPPFKETQNYVARIGQNYMQAAKGDITGNSVVVRAAIQDPEVSKLKKQAEDLSIQVFNMKKDMDGIPDTPENRGKRDTLKAQIAATSEVLSKVQTNLSNIVKPLQSQNEIGRDMDVESWANDLALTQRDLAATRMKFNSLNADTPPEEIKATIAKLKDLAESQRDQTIKIEQQKLGKATDSKDSELLTTKTKMDKVRIDAETAYYQELDQITRKERDLEKEQNRALGQIFKDRLELINTNAAKEIDAIKSKDEAFQNMQDLTTKIRPYTDYAHITSQQNQLDIMNMPENQYVYSSVQKAKLEEDIANEKSKMDKNFAYQDALKAVEHYQGLYIQSGLELDNLNMDLANLSKQVEDQRKVAEDGKAESLSKLADLEAAQKTLQAKVNDLSKMQGDYQAKSVEATNVAKANDPNASKPNTMGVMDQLRYTYSKQWKQASSPEGTANYASTAINEMTDTLKNFIETTIDASDSFGDFFDRITSGSHEAKQAFQQLGYDLLKSIYKVMMDRLTKQFLAMLFPERGGAAGAGGAGGFGALFGNVNTGGTVTTVNDKYAGWRTAIGWIGNIASAYLGSGMGGGNTTQAAGVQASGATTYGLGQNWNNSGITVQAMATGGRVTGGTANKDSVPIMAMPDEWVIPKSSTEVLGADFLNGLMTNPQSMKDGVVKPIPVESMGKKAPSLTNVYVVSPDQQPSTMGANDVVVAVQDNISRNGPLKKLIKQVANE